MVEINRLVRMGAKNERGLSRSAMVGVVAFVFLVIGYQTALFVHSAAVAKIAANRDEPDTVFVYEEAGGGSFAVAQDDRWVAQDDMRDAQDDKVAARDNKESSQDGRKDVPYIGKGEGRIARKPGHHTARAEAIREKIPRQVESFRFDPNTVSKEDLRRLGFSEKQAQSIVNYREKGGRFRRKSDFAKSFVVSDSIYKRLEPYIRIPKTDLNQADSAAFDALPGIGGWFASKMVAYRRELGGYSSKEQLMEIYRFDREKFDGLKDLVTVRQPYRYPLWQLPADSLRRHPYIRNYETARAIVLFRDNNPPEKWTVAALAEAGVFTMEQAMKFSRCVSTGSQN